MQLIKLMSEKRLFIWHVQNSTYMYNVFVLTSLGYGDVHSRSADLQFVMIYDSNGDFKPHLINTESIACLSLSDEPSAKLKFNEVLNIKHSFWLNSGIRIVVSAEFFLINQCAHYHKWIQLENFEFSFSVMVKRVYGNSIYKCRRVSRSADRQVDRSAV